MQHLFRFFFPDKNFQKLVTAGGLEGLASLADVQVLDLSEKRENCTNLPALPYSLTGSVGIYLDGKLVVCGGFYLGSRMECYYLDKGAQIWGNDTSLTVSRYGAAAVKLSSTEWWITGGISSTTSLSTTEIKVFGISANENYTRLPHAFYNHNLFPINDTHYVLTGNNGEDFVDEVWIFDKGSMEWSHLAYLPQTISKLQAGLVKYSNGSRQLIVVGTYNEDVCYGLDLDSLEWTNMTAIGADTYNGAVVPYGNTFLLVGGAEFGRGMCS